MALFDLDERPPHPDPTGEAAVRAVTEKRSPAPVKHGAIVQCPGCGATGSIADAQRWVTLRGRLFHVRVDPRTRRRFLCIRLAARVVG